MKISDAYGYQAFRILQINFVIFTVVLGLDKFFYFFTNWTNYLSPFAQQFLEGNEESFMLAIGIVEVIIGIGIIFKPRFFSYLIAVWLLVIFINFLLLGKYLDVAIRNLNLLLSALALGRLSQKFTNINILN